jgi:hypothetical protein
VSLEFMKTLSEIEAPRLFQAGGVGAELACVTFFNAPAGARATVLTTVVRASVCRAAVNCWIWK